MLNNIINTQLLLDILIQSYKSIFFLHSIIICDNIKRLQ